LKTSRVVP